MVCIYQINYQGFFFLNFWLMLPIGKTIIMSSLGSGQLDFVDLDFFFLFIKARSCFSLYLGGMRLWRDFQTALSAMQWTGGWAMGVINESSYRPLRVPVHLYFLNLTLLKMSMTPSCSCPKSHPARVCTFVLGVGVANVFMFSCMVLHAESITGYPLECCLVLNIPDPG